MKQLTKSIRIIVAATLLSAGLSSCANLSVFSDDKPIDRAKVVTEPRGQDVWRSGHQYVSLVNKGRGSTQNDHPLGLSSAEVKALLSSVALGSGFIIKSQDEPVFSAGELQVLSVGLAKALTEAKGDEDVTFATVGLHPTAFDKEKKATSGRVFVRQGDLHIIFGLLHDEYEGVSVTDEGTSKANQLTPGIRLSESDLASSLALKPGQTLHRDPKTGDVREDWLVIDIDSVLASRSLTGPGERIVSKELSQDIERNTKEADNIKQDISNMKEVLFELTDEVERLRRELDALKQVR